MNFAATNIPDVIMIEPRVFSDDRGFFMETYQEQLFKEAGIDCSFVQDNQSGSRRGVLRGLHYQIQQAQGKLVRCSIGEIFDVAVDLRRSSPNFGRWAGVYLSGENKRSLWIPPGFAHGFYTLSDWAEVLYKATDFYAPQWERTLIWNDPQIAIEWPLHNKETPILSDKDARGSSFNDAPVYNSLDMLS